MVVEAFPTSSLLSLRTQKRAGGKAAAAVSKKGEKWTWEAQIPTTLRLMSQALRLKSDRIWTTTQERDAFIKYVLLLCFHSLERFG